MNRARTTLLLAAATVAGCAYDTRVVIKVADPGHVTVRTTGPDGAALPAGTEAADVILAQGRLATGEDTSSNYTLHAVRSADHSISLRWDTRLSLEHGENLTLLTPSAKVRLMGARAHSLTLEQSAGALQIPLCARLVHDEGADGDGNYYDFGYASSIAPQAKCSADLKVPMVVEAPATEVTIREKRTPRRAMAGGLMAITSLCTLPLGIAFVAVGNNLKSQPYDHSLGSTFVTVGWIPIAVGALVDVLLLPTLVAPSEDAQVYPASG